MSILSESLISRDLARADIASDYGV